MIQINDNSNKIKENKYKILRMSLLLGNGEDKEETINNFEDAAREIDAMNDQIYLKDIESKFYNTVTLEEEEKKLTVLVDYIGGRVEQRLSLLEDFNNVTGYELTNLPAIKYQDRLEEYKDRLFYIKEYLENTKEIEKLNREIDNLENDLNSSYVNKAKAEDRNNKSEEELLNRFNNIIKRHEEFQNINIDNAELKLSDIKAIVDDSKKSLDIFNKSFATLNQAGISGEEKEEYLSYVNNAKEAYYNNKELEYLLTLYIIINKKESEYNQIVLKRDSINGIINERTSLRRDLKVMNEDILSNLYPALERQYNDIVKQKENIDNIEYLISEINSRKDLVSNLEKDNQKVEILSLLKEFCIIDTYDESEITETKTNEETSSLDNYSNNLNTSETNEFDSITNNIPEEETTNTKVETNSITAEQSNSEIPSFDYNSTPVTEKDSNTEEPEEENITETKEETDLTDYEENQVIEVRDAQKINIEAAVAKSNNVMRRVGEMLGVKIEKVDEKEQQDEKKEPTEEKDIFDKETVSEPETTEQEKTPTEITEQTDNSSSDENPTDIGINENIFMNENFDADPETATNSSLTNINTNQTPQENPLFNNELANKTIDDVMADNKNINDDDNNDFWFPQEDTPVDLNSLPDINTNEEVNNNVFFETNNAIPNLDFPSLDGQNTKKGED